MKLKKRPPAKIATCIGCGCDDLHACVIDELLLVFCHWLRVDYEAGRGVCSECPEYLARFDADARANRRAA